MAFTVDEIAQVIADAIESDEDASDTIDIKSPGIRISETREGTAAYFVVDADSPQRFRVTITRE